MNSTKKAARVAGLVYFLASLPAPFVLIYIPGKLIVRGDAAATAHNILASESLFRIGIVGELLSFAAFLFVPLALYRLLKGVDKAQASVMVALIGVSLPISLVNVLNSIAALTILRGPDYLSVFSQPQREALAMLFLKLHGQGFLIAEIFWGLWLVPFGVLVFKSGFLPRILGMLLIAACFGYLAESLTPLLLPHYVDTVGRFTKFLTPCELPIILWLLIMGARDQPLDPLASSSL
ncbi:MAG TPA: DUF4386 domain-containing protein [Methylomirabilota bacterium]|nr:DUF4386 domain-containing protein [Methylomirabilota bacterium]